MLSQKASRTEDCNLHSCIGLSSTGTLLIYTSFGDFWKEWFRRKKRTTAVILRHTMQCPQHLVLNWISCTIRTKGLQYNDADLHFKKAVALVAHFLPFVFVLRVLRLLARLLPFPHHRMCRKGGAQRRGDNTP